MGKFYDIVLLNWSKIKWCVFIYVALLTKKKSKAHKSIWIEFPLPGTSYIFRTHCICDQFVIDSDGIIYRQWVETEWVMCITHARVCQ